MTSTRSSYSKKPLSHKLGSEWAHEQKFEYSGACKRSKQCGASKWVSDANEWANGRASGPVLYGSISQSFGSPCAPPVKNAKFCFHKMTNDWKCRSRFHWKIIEKGRLIQFHFKSALGQNTVHIFLIQWNPAIPDPRIPEIRQSPPKSWSLQVIFCNFLCWQ